MSEPIRAYGHILRLTAAAAAAIVAIGLVSAPNATSPKIPRPVHVPAIQLQAIVNELTGGAPTTTTAITARSRAAVTPRANASLPNPNGVLSSALLTAAAIALTPVWYAAFPITLPASLIIAAFALSALSMIGLRSTPALTLQLGLAGWAVGPLLVVREATKLLASQINPAAAVSNSRLAADRAKRGLAGSGRSASPHTNADRKPTSHRTAKTTPTQSTDKKRTGTAGSARAVKHKP